MGETLIERMESLEKFAEDIKELLEIETDEEESKTIAKIEERLEELEKEDKEKEDKEKEERKDEQEKKLKTDIDKAISEVEELERQLGIDLTYLKKAIKGLWLSV